MEYLWVIAPSAGVGLLFYFAMKALFNADRKERQALAEAEREAGRQADAGTAGGENPRQ
ncbi:hypothetical protein HER39_18855 [Arthrobacter deserti]|uniref:Lysyl-tRNA synthetase n=1 Tax=Arthrobacter deserti TaxID=1742687 RepID=A0ABX1JUF1_9MICC|nr:hypothetical protein [Arthrobacter deserti]